MPQSFAGIPRNCPLCDAGEHAVVSTRARDGGHLRTVCCNSCGLVFSNPTPTQDELAAFYRWSYRADYKRTVYPRLKHIYRAARRALPRRQRLGELRRAAGRLLDVGAGGGEFMFLMRKLGFDVAGIEPNEGYGNFAREEYGLDVRVEPLESAGFAEASFDAITLNHVLEHLHDPVAALRRLRSWLKPAGVLVVEVPNVEAHYHAPATRFHFAHLFNFSSITLTATAARAGLKAVSTRLTPGVKHLNVAFVPDADAIPDRPAPEHARSITAQLRRHTVLRHMLSGHPYLRLLGNLRRPLVEHLALRGLDTPQAVLERVYENVT